MRSIPSLLTCLAISVLVTVSFSFNNAFAVELFSAGNNHAAYYDGEDWHTLYEESRINEYLSCFYAVWALSETDIYAAGKEGLLAHYDGDTWTVIETGTEEDLNDIWADSGSDIFVVGEHGTILYNNGMVWQEHQSGTTADLNAVWGVSGNNVYAAGNDILLNYDGHNWNLVDTGYPRDFTSVWASSGTDVYVGSASSYLLHFDGASWSEMPILSHTNDIWGTSSSDVFVALFNGYILRYDGEDWSSQYMSPPLNSLSGTSSSDVYGAASNGKIYHYDGIEWSPSLTIYHRADFMGVHAISEDFVVAVGMLGHAMAFDFDGADWSPIVPFVPFFTEVWGTSSDNAYLCARGPTYDPEYGRAYLYHWNGEEIVETADFPDYLNNWIRGIYGFSEDDIYLIADHNIHHFDGEDWTLVRDAGVVLWDIHGNSSDNVYAVGDRGTVYHYDGIEWTRVRYVPAAGTNEELYSVWVTPEGEVYAGGIVGYEIYYGFYVDWYSLLVHYDGSEWHVTYPNGTNNFSPSLESIWGDDSNDVFIGEIHTSGAGDDYFPNVIHFDGDDWNDLSCPSEPYDLWGTGPDDLYTCSIYGAEILHYNGVEWSGMTSPTSRTIYDLYGWGEGVTGGETPSPGPRLAQNYPNPFNPSTTISFTLSKGSHADLRIYDVRGRLVATLLDGKVQEGRTEILWNGKDSQGNSMASGIYFYRLKAGDYTETKKMVLLR